MDHCHTAGLISLELALEKLLEHPQSLSETETISLNGAADRITATDIISLLMFHHLIIQQWMDMAYVSNSGMVKHQCLSPVKHLQGLLSFLRFPSVAVYV